MQRTSQLLFDYWNEVRGVRLAPQRFEIEPSRIASLLPETFILERNARTRYLFRLAGTHVCEEFGWEFRGRNMLELWSGVDREAMTRILQTVCSEGAVGLIGFDAVTRTGRSVSYEMLLLPLVHTGNEISRVLGSATPKESPAWLGKEMVDHVRLKGFDMIWPDGKPHAVVSRLDRRAPFQRGPVAQRVVRSPQRSFRVYDGGLKDDDEAKH